MSLLVRWGVVGAGDASRRFSKGLAHVPDTALVATWTRRREPGEQFAQQFGGTYCETIDALMEAPLDAVYIGTHPDSHLEYTLAALRVGKHVLSEKPSMLNEHELDTALAEAKARGLLFMEAMKPPFFPLYRSLRRQLEQDPIGQVGYVRAGSSLANIPREHPLYNLHLGGGGLLGIAPYEAFLALDWLGPLKRVQTLGQLGDTGIDTFASLQTEHEHGIAQLYCGLGLHGHGDALLAGPLGNVAIDAKWWNPATATVRYVDGREVRLEEPIVSSGFNYETEHFCELVRQGEVESPILTHEVSRQMMRMLDAGRAALGLVYPQERNG